MYDLRTYLATNDLPGGPIYIPEEHLNLHEQYAMDDDRPMTQGRMVGGIISFVLLRGASVYLFLSI